VSEVVQVAIADRENSWGLGCRRVASH
jgi:hypothetical protein